MSHGLSKLLVASVISLVCAWTGLAAPKAADKEAAEREMAIKAAVAKFIAAMSEQNVDAFVEACGIPFSHEPGKLVKDKDTLRKMYKVEVEGRPPFEAHEVKAIETLKDAKARLGERGVKGYDEVLREDDFVVVVEAQRRGRKSHPRLLIKLTDGKATVVGWRPSNS
jgi:hypothetical protein